MRAIRRLWIVAVIVAVLVTAAALASFTLVNNESITPNNDFFVVSISPPPPIDIETWTLRIDGMVQNDVTLNYSELTSLPNVTEAASLRCVTGPSGRAYWTGVPISYVLDLIAPLPGSKEMVFYCTDGYSTSLTLGELNRSDIMLAWGMNGVTLPALQGYPVRLVIPEDWGYKWAKFIDHIEIVNYDYVGYWESRGWADNATISPGSDWYYHAFALSIAAVFGTFSAYSGVVISREAKLGRLPPERFGRSFHRSVSALFYAILFIAFIFWALRTEDLRGAVFFTFHGRMALLTVLVGIVGAASGIVMLVRPNRLKWLHWTANMTCYVLLLITIALGVVLAI
ncbi:MAG: molybdopterin-dependent oxidoreductase [Methanomassiliicoccales archaeon]|nr:molybdopterin-dependent oxidoreductase [Methanomassiliicoccales archaeon]